MPLPLFAPPPPASPLFLIHCIIYCYPDNIIVSLSVSEDSVSEDVGEINVCVMEMSRPETIQRGVIVNVVTQDGSATGMCITAI